jgi:hypothetical protein
LAPSAGETRIAILFRYAKGKAVDAPELMNIAAIEGC